MKKIYSILFSTRLTGFLFIIFAASMGIATFIENDYGTQASKALIYNAWWFELIMLLFVLNFLGNVFKYRLIRKEKISVILFHTAFILIIVGAAITRYISFEAMLPIKEGEASNLMLSEQTYLTAYVDDGKGQNSINKTFYFTPEPSKELRFIPLVARFLNFIRGGNDFSIKTDIKGQDYEINYVNYIANAFQDFKADNTGDEYLHFVESSGGSRHDHYIKKGEIENIHNVLVAFDKQTAGAINFSNINDSLKITTPFDGNYMVMATQETGAILKDSTQNFHLRALHTLGELQFVVPESPTKGNMIISSGPKDQHPEDMLELQIKTAGLKKNIHLYGTKYLANPPEKVSLGGLNFILSYGAKQLELPFFVKLRDFQLERYPGSNSPKSYASEVTVMDNGENFDFRIFMNHVLDHKGYRFFQSSYDDSGPVEETHLSVNHDFIGTWVTYIAYILLFSGLSMILMSKTTRFADLRRGLNKVKKKKASLLIILILSLQAFGQDGQLHAVNQEQIDSILMAQKVSQEHALNFGKLVIQDEGGRMKPVNTFTSELLRKVSKKDSYQGLDANQVAVSMVINPRIWFSVPFIYIKKDNTKVRELIGIPADQKYARLSDMLTDRGEYKLRDEVAQAHKKKIKNKYEESVLNIDNRVSLLYGAVFGDIFKFFPLKDDINNKWFAYVEHKNAGFKGTDSLYVANILPLYASALQPAFKDGNYQKADEFLESIHSYQRKFGEDVIPSERKIELELFYNKYDIFKNLFWQYMLVGVIMFIFLIIQIFNNSKTILNLVKISAIAVLLLFIYHTIGLIIRWYISGHVPWSNGYESMIYIAWATMLFGLLFGKKSPMTVAATTFVVAMTLMFAHMNWMDPSIGNLVPVLDSYWVMIHVSIIVASYGPFTLSMILGLIGLLLFAITNDHNKQKIKLQLKEITIINEMSMTVGLVLLTVGNFLGAMWANESWGRYWGWDPKETWALISIMIYAFVLHTRLIPGLRGRFTFNLLAFFAYSSILMTYLGVNHLLSGLHSYAVGDSAPIPYQIWTWLGLGVLLASLAFFKNKKYYKK